MITLGNIHKQLAEAIRLSGLSQTQIGKQLGVSQQTVSHYVKGDKMPSLDTLANLCIILDVDPADILCVNNYKRNND